MMRLRVSDFSYDLPPSFIAQEPPPRRDDSRLMVVHLDSGIVEHRYFREIARYLGNGALLVLNDSKVIPARLLGMKAETGGKVEVLLLRDLGRGAWECLLNPSARLRAGTVIALDDSPMMALVTGRHSQETHTVILSGVDDVGAEIDRVGHVPLPPYIKRRNPKPAMRRPSPPQAGESQTCPRQSGFPRLRRIPNPDRDLAQRDRERYQTVYARRPGAVAAPTAGLHFSQQLLRELSRGGTKMVPITLHVGLGTFRPVKELYVEEHRLHAEYFELGIAAAETINFARGEGRKIVAVGTTAARVLETAAAEDGTVRARSGWTDLFIYPPYKFKLVQNLLTNFHLPRSTLLMLVAAMVGRDKLLELYEIAKREGYRFYSYGDAMLILNPKSQIPNPNRGNAEICM